MRIDVCLFKKETELLFYEVRIFRNFKGRFKNELEQKHALCNEIRQKKIDSTS